MEEQEIYNLPEGWTWTTLDKICSKITDGSHNPPVKQDKGIPMLSARNIENYSINFDKDVRYISEDDYLKEKQRTNIEKGDVLLTIVGTIGRVSVVEQSQHFAIQRSVALLKPMLISSKYLMYYLSSPFAHKILINNSKGSAQKGIYLSTLKNIPVPITNIKEQHTLVSNIETLFSKLNEAEKGLKKAKRELTVYRYAFLKNLFEGKLTAKWREENTPKIAKQILYDLSKDRDKHNEIGAINWNEEFLHWKKNKNNVIRPVKPKQFQVLPYIDSNFVNLPKLPTEWEWIHWNDILDYKDDSFKRGPFGSALTKSIFVKNGYKVYEQYCAINDDCSFERYFITPEKYEELKSFSVRDGDFLISCSGVTLGRITQIPQKFKAGIINQALLRVRINKDIYKSKFFLYFFRSPYFQKQIFENSKGSAIPNIKGVKELKVIPVPLLTVEEQTVIIEILESRFTLVDNLEKTIDSVLKEITALQHSILKKAFEGRLVNPSSNESVETMLHGIEEEKKLYLEKQKELNRSKPKEKKKMEEKKSILEILKESNAPISAQELWEKSTSDGDIERFYSEIKEIYHQIDELKSKTESLLILKDENK